MATVGGLAVGAIGCGAAAVVARMPETSARRPGGLASLRPRIGLPSRLRAEFFAVVPTLVASWALGGLYLSLGPSVAATLSGLHDHLVGGFVVTLLRGTGAVTAFALRHVPVARVLLAASALLAVGTLGTLGGIAAGSTALAATGTVVAGIGFGAAAVGTFGTFARIAAPTERGELFAAAYTIAYLAFSVPAVVAGAAAGVVGLLRTAEVYGSAVALLGVSALVAQGMPAVRGRRAGPSTDPARGAGRVSSPVAGPHS